MDSRNAIDVISVDGIAAAALDQSHDLIAVLDADGTIVLTNAAWRAGADRRGADAATTGPGANYLEVCERGDAAAIAAGVRAVLAGDLPRFEADYPCHSPLEDGWFTVEVLSLGEHPGMGVVVTHTSITARVAATQPQRPDREIDPVTLLPTSPAAVKGLRRLLADTQAHQNSLAVVTVTVSDLVEIESRHGRRSRDELVIQVLSRIRRLTRADDVIFRASTNRLVVVAPVADARSAEYLCGRVSEVLQTSYLVGSDDIDVHVDVDVASSDRFSTLNSLLPGYSTAVALPQQDDSAAVSSDADPDGDAVDDVPFDTDVLDGDPVDGDASHLPLMVYSLPDGYLQAANDRARSLFGLATTRPHHLHVRDIADPADLRHTIAAMSALSSGATDSYRAQRTLVTDDGPLVLSTSVRRLAFGPGVFAVVLTVPVQPDESTLPATDDPLSRALVAGTIDADGTVLDTSDPRSPLETELVGALMGETVGQAAHPDESDRVAALLESMRVSGQASGAFRVLNAEQGWVPCQCQLFTIRPAGPSQGSDAPVVGHDTFGFVLSANVSTKSMVDRIARLERHIRRIGSEVSAADLETGARPSEDRSVAAALDALAPTDRQRDIVERLARGQRVSSIAAELFISRSTVRNHLAQVYRLAGVHSQDELLEVLRSH